MSADYPLVLTYTAAEGRSGNPVRLAFTLPMTQTVQVGIAS